MEEIVVESDVEFIKNYLKSSIELETQKRIAEDTFDQLVQEENQWKRKMSYTAKKENTSVSVLDMLFMAIKGFGISILILFAVTMCFSIIDAIGHRMYFLENLFPIIWLVIVVVLIFVRLIYVKKTDYKVIKDKYLFDQQKEINIKQRGNEALYIIQNNKNKLKQAYKYASNNLINTYSANIIYKKYQTVEACTAILEYLESGRCDTLKGPYGAYNKYDDDLAKGIIINRLEEINTKMNYIVANQERIYQVINRIEKNVDEMTKDIEFICDSVQETGRKLDDIANNTRITAWSSSVIATQVPDWTKEAENRLNKISV